MRKEPNDNHYPTPSIHDPGGLAYTVPMLHLSRARGYKKKRGRPLPPRSRRRRQFGDSPRHRRYPDDFIGPRQYGSWRSERRRVRFDKIQALDASSVPGLQRSTAQLDHRGKEKPCGPYPHEQGRGVDTPVFPDLNPMADHFHHNNAGALGWWNPTGSKTKRFATHGTTAFRWYRRRLFYRRPFLEVYFWSRIVYPGISMRDDYRRRKPHMQNVLIRTWAMGPPEGSFHRVVRRRPKWKRGVFGRGRGKRKHRLVGPRRFVRWGIQNASGMAGLARNRRKYRNHATTQLQKNGPGTDTHAEPSTRVTSWDLDRFGYLPESVGPKRRPTYTDHFGSRYQPRGCWGVGRRQLWFEEARALEKVGLRWPKLGPDVVYTLKGRPLPKRILGRYQRSVDAGSLDRKPNWARFSGHNSSHIPYAPSKDPRRGVRAPFGSGTPTGRPRSRDRAGRVW